MSDMLDIARAYVAAGMSVIPIERGGKLPDHHLLKVTTGQQTNWVASDERAAWRVYCGRLPTDGELETWFAEGDAGIGIVGGAVSGGLVRIDFEDVACLPTWISDLNLRGRYLAAAASMLPVVFTGKGMHVYLRMPDPPGHLVLSSQGSGNDMLVLAETQGEGCYCVAPPSVVPNSIEFTREAGLQYTKCYTWATTPWPSFTAIPMLATEVAAQLLDAAKFTSFWRFLVRDHLETLAMVHRGGINLEQSIGGVVNSWFLPWEAVATLRDYLAHYDLLLRAVESAPPPPPSFYAIDDEF